MFGAKRVCLCVAWVLMSWGCQAAPETGAPVTSERAIEAGARSGDQLAPGEARFGERLREIAASYGELTKVGRLQWAPTLCKAPVRAERDDELFHSEAKGGAHGQKLYRLYVSDAPSYQSLNAISPAAPDPDAKPWRAPEGTVIVKESWAPREVEAASMETVTRGDVHYAPGEQRALFVMYRLDPSTPDTDDGWVYGTLTPDGERVTGAGRLATCMGCHEAAPHGRLFGLQH